MSKILCRQENWAVGSEPDPDWNVFRPDRRALHAATPARKAGSEDKEDG